MLREGLVGHWKLDGNALDSSGNNNHGTISGGLVFEKDDLGVSAKFGGLGTNNSISKTSFSGFNNNNFTVCGWVKRRSSGLQQGIFETQWSGTTTAFRLIFSVDNTMAFSTYNGATVSSISPATLVDTWYYVCVSYDSGISLQKFYINGVLIDSDIQTGTLSGGASPTIFIGADTTLNTFTLNGNIKDVRIYNRALNNEEIKELYNEGKNIGFRGSYGLIESTGAES